MLVDEIDIWKWNPSRCHIKNLIISQTKYNYSLVNLSESKFTKKWEVFFKIVVTASNPKLYAVSYELG